MRVYSQEAMKAKLARRNRIRKVLGAVSCAAALLIIACAACILYQKAVRKSDSVSLFGYRSYLVLSGSMEPAILPGDIVVARTVEESQVAEGDIVTFVDEDGVTVTHRIMEVITEDGKKYYRTRGDSNNADDIGLISIENIKGKYSFKISRDGLLMKTIMTSRGMVISVLVAVILYTAMSRKSDRRTARHYIRKRHQKQDGDQERE